MIVLHALWDNVQSNKLHIWAETSNQPASTSKRSGRKAEALFAQSHPFALSSAALQEMVGELAGSLHTHSTIASTLTLRLPSTAKEPVASPELLLAQESSGGKATGLKSWTVETLSLDPGLALDVLLALPDYATSRVAFGGSLRFWKEAAKFALALLTRQCYIPALEETKQQGRPVFRAAWQAVLLGEDAERLFILTKAMPPLCWSMLPTNEVKFSALQNIVQSFLNHTLDAFIRENLSATSLLPVQRGRNRRNGASSLPEQWLQALTSENPVLTATADELRSFAEKLRGWLEQMRPVDANAAFRTCFRLDAPGADESQGSGWHISFYLQANDDRSLLVPVEKVWNERSNTLTFLSRTFENPQERVLADLGKASRLFPTLEKSLRTARPMGLKLDTEQAYAFLRESAPLLEQSGFGVLVPPWWNKPTARLGVKLKVKPKASAKNGSGLLGLNSIVAYDWTIAVGDTTLTIEEFEDLVDLKVPLIKIRGQWVELRPEEIEAAIAFFKKKHGQGDMSLGEALRIGLGQETSELGLPVTDIEGSGWISEMLDKLTDGMKIAPIQQPSTLQGKLRPYQLKGVSWLAFLERFGLGACLADDMGLGKCVSATTLLTVNGTLQKAEDIWHSYAGESMFDGQGYWADAGKQLLTNSIDETSGRIVQTSIKRLYRQHVSESLRTVRLEDGNSVTITHVHKLLTDKGWTNELCVGDYVCAYAQIDQEVYDCRIKMIEEVEYNGWVYDFEVEQHHNFVANNIICHNTVQLITLLLHERTVSDEKEQSSPTLLICPMSIVGNWHRELQRFAPSLRVMIHHGHERLSGEAFAQEARQNDIVITTYALALRDKEHLALVEWDNVVVDEAQNIKNDTAKQTQAIKQLQGQHKIALTGTPVENRLSELWSIMEFLNPGYLGSATDFRKNFAIPIERYREANRSEALKRLIQPFVLRRLKTDKTIIADLPDKMEMKVYCNLTQEQASLYEAVVKDMMAKIEEAEGIERKGLVLSTLLKLKQVCNHPAQFVADGSALPGRSGKLARLEEMLEEVLAEGDKALIFTQFAEMGKLLRGYLQERFACETLFLHGGTPKKQRDIMVQRFQEERRGAPLFLLSLKAGGVGLNLTAANHVFHFDRWWNPAVENQATDRAFRIGQKRNVQVHKFVCIGTMEEHIDQMIEQKKELAESIVGTGENWLTEMSTAQLRELFALSRESVSL